MKGGAAREEKKGGEKGKVEGEKDREMEGVMEESGGVGSSGEGEGWGEF